MTWTLKELLKRFDYGTGGVTAEQLKNLDEQACQQLLLEKADYLFAEGRYSHRTEMSLEMYQLQEAEQSLYDLRQISELTDSQRIKLKFYQHLKELCFPLFSRQPVDLTAAPFGFSNPEFSIMNRQLLNFLYDSPYTHLSIVLCIALVNTYKSGENMPDTVVASQLNDQIFYGHIEHERDADKQRQALDKLIDDIYRAENHLRVGKLLGLSAQAQAIYDMTDTYICTEYLYNQVLFAQELAGWIAKNWVPEPREKRENTLQLLLQELNVCAQRHQVVFADKQHTINQIIYDLLGVPMFDEKEYSYPDDEEEDW